MIFLFIKILAAPGQPENPRVVSKKDTSMFLKWGVPKADGGSAISGYIIDQRMEEEDNWISCNR